MIELMLNDVTKRRMAQVMAQCRRFGHVGINAGLLRQSRLFREKILRESTCNLRYFKRVRESVVKYVSFIRGCNLSNASEPPEGGAVQDAVAISLERRALIVGAIYRMESVVTTECRGDAEPASGYRCCLWCGWEAVLRAGSSLRSLRI